MGVGLGLGGSNPTGTAVDFRHDQYTIAKTDLGLLYIQDKVAGRSLSTSIGSSGATVSDSRSIVFADGVGRFDPNGTAETIAHLYRAALNRSPEAAGLDYFTNIVETRTGTIEQVAQTFVESQEFQSHYGALDNTAFVQQLYRNVLGRAGEQDGVNYWTGQLDAGETRGGVLLGFATSFENVKNNLASTGDQNYGEDYRLYQAALNRTPEAKGLAYWYQSLRSGATLQDVAHGFLASPEFNATYGSLNNNDFVQQLYSNVLHRGGDATGIDYWTSSLNQGSSRENVLLSFSDSFENRLATAAATHDNWVFLGHT